MTSDDPTTSAQPQDAQDDHDLDRHSMLLIERLAERIEQFTTMTDTDRDWVHVQPGSSLAGDDARSAPYQLSHGVALALMNAGERLHANAALLTKAHTIYRDAPFVLGRSAIEAACTALWLLLPPQRLVRIQRRLYLVREDILDSVSAHTHLTGSPPRDAKTRARKVEDFAHAAGIILPKPRSVPTTSLVREVHHQVDSPSLLEDPLAIWYVGSGFTHGRQWAALGLLEREIAETSNPDVVNVRTTGSASRVLWSLSAACHLLDEGKRLFDQRRTSHLG